MRTFEPGTHVRVMQEGWGVFQNLPATAERFEQLTGCTVEVTLTVIPEMWELMERSFSGEDPPFDLVGVDDLLLIEAARAGRVMALDEYIARDGYSLDDFTPQAIEAVSDRGSIYGLPYCDVSSVLIYRADLFERYGIAVPTTMDELTEAALAIQAAVRADGQEDFYGITLRGAPNCGLNFWIVGSTWGPSWGASWYDDERAADARHARAARRGRALLQPAAAGRAARVVDDDVHRLYGLLRRGPRRDGGRACQRGVDPVRRGRPGRRGHTHRADPRGPARHAPRWAVLPAIRDPVARAVEGRRLGARQVPVRTGAGAAGRTGERLHRGVP